MPPHRLREIREARGLTQQQMAAALGLSQSAYFRIELGQRRLAFDDAVRAAAALGCSLADLAAAPQGAAESFVACATRIAARLHDAAERTGGKGRFHLTIRSDFKLDLLVWARDDRDCRTVKLDTVAGIDAALDAADAMAATVPPTPSPTEVAAMLGLTPDGRLVRSTS